MGKDKLVECPICGQTHTVYIADTCFITDGQEFDGVDLWCGTCGSIGTIDITINVRKVNIHK